MFDNFQHFSWILHKNLKIIMDYFALEIIWWVILLNSSSSGNIPKQFILNHSNCLQTIFKINITLFLFTNCHTWAARQIIDWYNNWLWPWLESYNINLHPMTLWPYDFWYHSKKNIFLGKYSSYVVTETLLLLLYYSNTVFFIKDAWYFFPFLFDY